MRSIVVSTALCALVACGSDGTPDTSDAPAGWSSVHCSNSDTSTTPTGGCTRSYSGCRDGHSYGIECEATTCTCRIDSVATGRAITYGCGDVGLQGLATNCDWHNH